MRGLSSVFVILGTVFSAVILVLFILIILLVILKICVVVLILLALLFVLLSHCSVPSLSFQIENLSVAGRNVFPSVSIVWHTGRGFIQSFPKNIGSFGNI